MNKKRRAGNAVFVFLGIWAILVIIGHLDDQKANSNASTTAKAIKAPVIAAARNQFTTDGFERFSPIDTTFGVACDNDRFSGRAFVMFARDNPIESKMFNCDFKIYDKNVMLSNQRIYETTCVISVIDTGSKKN